MRTMAWRLIATLGMMGLVLGCGDSKPSVSSSTTEAKVKGTVTIKGKPAKSGEVEFDPSNYRRKHEVARTAPIQKDGTYSITTLVGENMVKVLGPEAEKVGGEYTNLTFDVQPGENTYNIELGR